MSPVFVSTGRVRADDDDDGDSSTLSVLVLVTITTMMAAHKKIKDVVILVLNRAVL